MCEQNSAFPGTILAIVTTTPENWKGYIYIYSSKNHYYII